MVSSNRPPLEIDELTDNLKQSSGKGIDAFFPPQPETSHMKHKAQESESISSAPAPQESHENPHSKPKSIRHDFSKS